MYVNVHYQLNTEPTERDVHFKDWTPEVEWSDARYNLAEYGRYWVYSVNPPRLLVLTDGETP